MNTHKITLLGVLTSIALVLAIVESFIPSFGIPGIKLGLANIIILITLYELGVKEAIFVNLIRVVLAGILRGSIFSMGFLMSFTGAVLSLAIMVIFKVLIKQFSIIGVSVIGAIFHVSGQIIIAIIFLGSMYVLYYLPIIAITSIATGIVVGIIANTIIRSGVIKKQREKYNF